MCITNELRFAVQITYPQRFPMMTSASNQHFRIEDCVFFGRGTPWSGSGRVITQTVPDILIAINMTKTVRSNWVSSIFIDLIEIWGRRYRVILTRGEGPITPLLGIIYSYSSWQKIWPLTFRVSSLIGTPFRASTVEVRPVIAVRSVAVKSLVLSTKAFLAGNGCSFTNGYQILLNIIRIIS